MNVEGLTIKSCDSFDLSNNGEFMGMCISVWNDVCNANCYNTGGINEEKETIEGRVRWFFLKNNFIILVIPTILLP